MKSQNNTHSIQSLLLFMTLVSMSTVYFVNCFTPTTANAAVSAIIRSSSRTGTVFLRRNTSSSLSSKSFFDYNSSTTNSHYHQHLQHRHSLFSFQFYDTHKVNHSRLFFSTTTTNPSSPDDNASEISNNSNSKKAKILFLGTPDVAATTLKTIFDASQQNDSSFEIVGVVTQPPKRRKRKGKEEPSPVGLVAEELDIPVLWPEKAKDPEFLHDLETFYKPDLCITAAYGQYLPKRFLAIPKYGTLNIHPSLLPRWRGASPVQRSLEAGDNPIGVSVLFTVSKMDAGPIVAQKEETIDDEIDDATKLLPYLFDIGTKSLLEVIPDVVSGKITMENALKQDESLVVNADMIDSSEGELKVWEENAKVCHNRIRGFSMWPGTFLYFRIGDDDNAEPVKVKVIKSKVLHDKAGSVDCTDDVVLGPSKTDGLRIVCGDGSVLELLEIQPVTRKAMDAKSFVNGLRGERLRWVKSPENK